MAYQICKRCGGMYLQNGRRYCQTCYEKQTSEYERIVEHLRHHPGASIMDIITETGVSLKTIDCLVEDGDVSYIESNQISISPEKLKEFVTKSGKGTFYTGKKWERGKNK